MSAEEQKQEETNPWPEATEVVLDIIREEGTNARLNRFCRDPETQV